MRNSSGGRTSASPPRSTSDKPVRLAMIGANEGRLMCIPKCTHSHLLEHIPASAYATNDYAQQTKKSSRSPRLKAHRNPDKRSKSPVLRA